MIALSYTSRTSETSDSTSKKSEHRTFRRRCRLASNLQVGPPTTLKLHGVGDRLRQVAGAATPPCRIGKSVSVDDNIWGWTRPQTARSTSDVGGADHGIILHLSFHLEVSRINLVITVIIL
jgi:hypothetical protein